MQQLFNNNLCKLTEGKLQDGGCARVERNSNLRTREHRPKSQINKRTSMCLAWMESAGQIRILPALALRRVHRRSPLGRASGPHTAPPLHSLCTLTCEERAAGYKRPPNGAAITTWTPTRRRSPALPGGWSQSRHAARRVWRGAPLNKHTQHLLTVCLMLFPVYDDLCENKRPPPHQQHADLPRFGLRGD